MATVTVWETPRSPQDLERLGLLAGLGVVPPMYCLLGWLWSMGSLTNSVVPGSLGLGKGFFQFAIVYPAIYVLVFCWAFLSTNPIILGIIFPLHFFAMFCLLYDLYFVSKSLTIAETCKTATFYDYAGPFFLLWFFPVGVWFVQPRINQLYAKSTAHQSSPRALEPPLSAASSADPSLEISDRFTQGVSPVYAGFWLRAAATFIDALVLFFPFVALTFFMAASHKLLAATHKETFASIILVLWPLGAFAGATLYFALLESSSWRATLGKMAVGVYLADCGGQRIALGRAIGRNTAKFLSATFGGVGFCVCGFTKKKQALHDIIAGCLVLRRVANR